MIVPGRRLQLGAAIGSAAVMAAGLVFFQWPTFIVLALYWLENVVIGVFTVARILAAGARTERYGAALAGAAFFTVHYGMFCFVHGALLAALFGNFGSVHSIADPLFLMIGRIAGDRIGVLVVMAMVIAAALDAMRSWATTDAQVESPIRSIMNEPYGRIVVLHVVLIAGGFLVQVLHLPSLAALLLVAFKLAYDLRRLQRDQTMSANSGAVARPPG